MHADDTFAETSNDKFCIMLTGKDGKLRGKKLYNLCRNINYFIVVCNIPSNSLIKSNEKNTL